MSDTPSKPKPGSLRDRIAAFEKQQPANPTPGPPAPRPKPGGLQWKPRASSPPSSPPKDDPEHKPAQGGMSASDAKESIGKGGSLKERMAALQGRGGFGGAPSSPPIAPKPAVERPKWKPPPRVASPPADEESQPPRAKSTSPTPQDKPASPDASIESEKKLGVPTEEEEKPIVPIDDGAAADPDPEEEERQRRAAIAARMARLGGAKFGMGPPVIGKKPPVPQKKRTTSPKPSDAPAPEDNASIVSRSSAKSPEPVAEATEIPQSPPATKPSSTDTTIPHPQEEGSSAEVKSPPAENPTSPPSKSNEPDTTSDYFAAPATSPPPQKSVSSVTSPPAMPVPAAPRRAGPPRRKAQPPKSPSPAPPSTSVAEVSTEGPSPSAPAETEKVNERQQPEENQSAAGKPDEDVLPAQRSGDSESVDSSLPKEVMSATDESPKAPKSSSTDELQEKAGADDVHILSVEPPTPESSASSYISDDSTDDIRPQIPEDDMDHDGNKTPMDGARTPIDRASTPVKVEADDKGLFEPVEKADSSSAPPPIDLKQEGLTGDHRALDSPPILIKEEDDEEGRLAVLKEDTFDVSSPPIPKQPHEDRKPLFTQDSLDKLEETDKQAKEDANDIVKTENEHKVTLEKPIDAPERAASDADIPEITSSQASMQPTKDGDEENVDEEAARKQRVAERMAKMGGFNPFAASPPPQRQSTEQTTVLPPATANTESTSSPQQEKELVVSPDSNIQTSPLTASHAEPREIDEEEEEASRKKRVAERLAKMGGVNPFAGPLPPKRQSVTSEDTSHPPLSARQDSANKTEELTKRDDAVLTKKTDESGAGES